MCISLSVPEGKHWPCLQSLSQTSGHSLLDGPKGAQGQSEDEAETVSAMASLTVDVEQQASVLNNTETGRSAAPRDSFTPWLGHWEAAAHRAHECGTWCMIQSASELLILSTCQQHSGCSARTNLFTDIVPLENEIKMKQGHTLTSTNTYLCFKVFIQQNILCLN